MKYNLLGVAEIAEMIGGSTLDETPPAYSEAAKKATDKFKGNKTQLFLEEVGIREPYRFACFLGLCRFELYHFPRPHDEPSMPSRCPSYLVRFRKPEESLQWVSRKASRKHS